MPQPRYESEGVRGSQSVQRVTASHDESAGVRGNRAGSGPAITESRRGHVMGKMEGEASRDMKPCYLGPMIVLRRTRNGAYRLGELDGSISRLHYAAFRLIPYHARSRSFIPVTHVVDGDTLASPDFNDTSERGAGDLHDESTREGRNLNPPGDVTIAYALSSETSHAR